MHAQGGLLVPRMQRSPCITEDVLPARRQDPPCQAKEFDEHDVPKMHFFAVFSKKLAKIHGIRIESRQCWTYVVKNGHYVDIASFVL